MEDNVRATYICWKCNNEYVEFNIKEGEPAKCPQCKTINYPGYEVIMITFSRKKFKKKLCVESIRIPFDTCFNIILENDSFLTFECCEHILSSKPNMR